MTQLKFVKINRKITKNIYKIDANKCGRTDLSCFSQSEITRLQYNKIQSGQTGTKLGTEMTGPINQHIS